MRHRPKTQLIWPSALAVAGSDRAGGVLVSSGITEIGADPQGFADAFKLTWVSGTIYPRPELILCLSDPSAAAQFIPGGRSRTAQALQDLGIAICVVDLPGEIRQSLMKAQQRQYR